MKEYYLKNSYANIAQMVNSDESGAIVSELMGGDVDSYAIVSLIGNRYDICGNKIIGFVENPFIGVEKATENVAETAENCEKIEEKGEKTMKYIEIEALIDQEVEKATADLRSAHDAEIAELSAKFSAEVGEMTARFTAEIEQVRATAKAEAKAELLNLLNS